MVLEVGVEQTRKALLLLKARRPRRDRSAPSERDATVPLWRRAIQVKPVPPGGVRGIGPPGGRLNPGSHGSPARARCPQHPAINWSRRPSAGKGARP
jgi:hypothetical protein